MAKRGNAGAGVTGRTTKASASGATTAGAGVRRGNLGRSGGVVDAPGKKHRAQRASDPGANIADSQAAKMRTAMTMEKTNRRRGRG
jgi:hypothetical protein